MKQTLAALASMAAAAAPAHDGHGQESTHWHATDAWGLMAGLAAAGLLMWWRNRK